MAEGDGEEREGETGSGDAEGRRGRVRWQGVERVGGGEEQRRAEPSREGQGSDRIGKSCRIGVKAVARRCNSSKGSTRRRRRRRKAEREKERIRRGII